MNEIQMIKLVDSITETIAIARADYRPGSITFTFHVYGEDDVSDREIEIANRELSRRFPQETITIERGTEESRDWMQTVFSGTPIWD